MHRFLGPLLLREGCEVIQVPVCHRPRRHGQSHYSLWNRSFKVLVDLAGVRWLLSRRIVWQVVSKGALVSTSVTRNEGRQPAEALKS
jgi:dolichol-phosphate mannosyltransferase